MEGAKRKLKIGPQQQASTQLGEPMATVEMQPLSYDSHQPYSAPSPKPIPSQRPTSRTCVSFGLILQPTSMAMTGATSARPAVA